MDSSGELHNPPHVRQSLEKEHRITIEPERDESTHNLRNGKSNKDAGKLTPFRAYFRLWTFANRLDVFFRVIGAAAALGAGTGYPLMTIIFGGLVNAFNDIAVGRITPAAFRSKVNDNTLWFVYLFIGKFGLLYISNFLFSFTATRMSRRIRLAYLSKVLRQPISYFDKHTPGSVAANLSANTNLIEVGLADKVGAVFISSSMLITAFAVGFSKSWKLTLVVGTTIPWAVVVTMVLGTANSKLEKMQREAYSQSSSIAEEALSSVTSITTLGAVDKLIAKFKRPLTVASSYIIKKGPVEASMYGNMFFSMQCGYALALFYGVKLVSDGDIKNGGTVMMFVAVVMAILMGSSAMGLIAPSIPSFLRAGVAAQQVLSLLDEDSTTENTACGKNDSWSNPEAINWNLKVQRVAFRYPQRPTVTVLDDFNLDIPAEKVTAVVGSSGSGKSTVIGLLERWYEPETGSIYLDGTDIRKLDVNWLRQQIGLVQQDPILFNDTILQNVLNGLHENQLQGLDQPKLRELAIDACIQANANEFIVALPHGYDTIVGEHAGLISGGQKQRIAIARSVISNPRILLLDEATSSLDSESENAVQAALEHSSTGRTVLMISHKLSTVEKADNIVVMEKGKIVEQGNHAALLALGGVYCRLLQAESRDTRERVTTKAGREIGTHQTSITSPEKIGLPIEATTTPPNLQSKAISRRLSLIRCVFTLLFQTRSTFPAFLAGTAASLVAGGCIPMQAYLFSKLVTVFQLSGSERTSRGNLWALMFFCLALANLFSYAILWFFFAFISATISRKYRANYLRAFLSQDIGFFEQKGNASGALAALLATDGDDLEIMFSMSLGLLMVFQIDIFACGILAIAVGWKLGLVGVLGCFPVLFLAGYFRMRMDTSSQDRCAANFLESARFGSEAIEAIKTITSLNMEERVVERYRERLRSAAVTSFRKMIVGMVFFSLSDCADFLAVALVFWYGGKLVSTGDMSVQNYFLVYTSVIFGGQGAGFIFGYSSSITKAQAAMNRMLFMSQQKAPINSSTGMAPSTMEASSTLIEFKDVNFTYPKRPTIPILTSLSLRIPAGSNTCIVGPSGSGKSTIIHLLERFYDISSGQLLINNDPISSLDITAWRKQLGLVSQETVLYQGTIRENLSLGVQGDLSQDEMEEACKDASIHDFITSLPEGYDTDCGSRGLSLSGGQRQRLAIARALLRNPKILLLDEATSALDPESQKLVVDALERAKKGRTMVCVSHQMEIVRAADNVVVIEKGRVVEEGTYKSLMERRGRFWKMEGELASQA